MLPVPQPSSVATPQGDGSATCAAGTSIALMGPFKGEYADAVMPLHDGAMLAVDQFTGANPGCRVTAKEFDTGNAQQAAAVAAEIIADPTILAVIGPAFSEEVTAAGAAFSAAGMVAASATATLPDLTTNGWTTFFRGLGTDADGLTATGSYLAGEGYRKACVISLKFPETVEEARIVSEELGSAVDPSCSGVAVGDFVSNVASIKAANPDVVYYSAGTPPAAELLAMLRNEGVTADYQISSFASPSEFLQIAGAAAEGTHLVCACLLPSEGFAADFQKAFGRVPGRYALEGYEMTTIALTGIGSGAATDRPSMLNYFRGYDGYGVAQQYKWAKDGELVTPAMTVSQVGAEG